MTHALRVILYIDVLLLTLAIGLGANAAYVWINMPVACPEVCGE